jgi:trans-aconitate methyltransferase
MSPLDLPFRAALTQFIESHCDSMQKLKARLVLKYLGVLLCSQTHTFQRTVASHILAVQVPNNAKDSLRATVRRSFIIGLN